MKSRKNYLILQLQESCYSSYSYFSGRIARVLRGRGHDTTVFCAADEPLERLERFAGAHFDAIIGCNCPAPRFTTETGTLFLDEIDAPFFNLLLDHPLYHHDSLKCALKNYHVRCLDENHAAYVQRYYPHIKSVGLWTAVGEPAAQTDGFAQETDIAPPETHAPVPIRARRIPVLFSGTYTDPDDILRAIGELPPFIRSDLKLLIAELLEHTNQTIEGAICALGDTLESYLPEAMPLYVQSCFLADTYVRAYRRRALIQAAERARLPLALCGDGWEKLPRAADSTLALHPQIPFACTFSLMADSRITLNLMPEFKAGFHDRVFSAMQNGSVAATDPSRALLRAFTDERELLFYDAARPDTACERLRRALEAPERLQQIADAGFAAAKRFSWENVIPDFGE